MVSIWKRRREMGRGRGNSDEAKKEKRGHVAQFTA
jgi:hypothetical protein